MTGKGVSRVPSPYTKVTGCRLRDGQPGKFGDDLIGRDMRAKCKKRFTCNCLQFNRDVTTLLHVQILH